MLDLNIWVMLIEAGIFLVTLVFLKKYLFDPLVKFMDEREAKLEEELKMIEKNKAEAERLKNEIDKIISEAKHEAREIVNKAKEEAVLKAQEERRKKEKEIEEAKEELRKVLEAEKEEILADLLKSKDEIVSLIQNKIRNAA
jgi:F-type H+-transporting ATPase subunit b